MKNSTQRRESTIAWGLAGLVYAAAAVLVTWPLAQRMVTDLPGPSADSLLHYWNGWWVQQALRTGANPYYCDLLFYPNGVSLATHNLAWVQIVLWLPLQTVLGGLASYNLALLITLVACGLAAYALVRELVGDRRAALVAGLIYLAWPFRISQLDHPNLVGTMLVPLLLLAVMRLIQQPRLWRGLLVGLCAAGVGVARWQALIPAGVMVVVWLACQGRRLLAPPVLRGLAVAIVAAALLLAPFALMLARTQEAAPAELIREEEAMQTDLLAFVTPPAGHPLWGRLTAPLYDRYYAQRTPHRRVPMYLGVSVLALSIVGLATARRKAWPWAIMALLMGGLALGSPLRVGGQVVSVPTLYGLLTPLRVFGLMREPERYGLFMALPLAALAGQGLAWLLERPWLQGAGRGMGAVAVVGAVVIGEYLQIPVSTMHPLLSPYHAGLRGDLDAGAVLDLPLDTMQAKWYMFAQTTHQRPIVMGNLSRLPSDALAYVMADPWLREIAVHDEMPPWQTSVTEALGRLRTDGVTHIVLHKNRVGADRVAHWRRYLAMQPIYEDDLIVVYTTAPRADEHYAVTPLWEGLGPVDVRLSTDCQRPGGIVAVDVVWGTSAEVAPVPDLRLALRDATGVTVVEKTYPLLGDGREPSLPPNALEWGSYALRLPADLPEGRYTLMLDLGDGALAKAAPRWDQVQVLDRACPLAEADGLTPADALFGEQLRLLGYALEQVEGELQVQLLWRAEQRMATDYTIFVHVYERDTGVPVAQDDAMPRRGALPTRFWMVGEVVDDRVTVSLKGVDSGAYGVLVGIYDSATGERLPLQVGGGVADPDGRLILAEMWEVP